MARYTDIDDKKFPKRYEGYTDFARGWNACLDTIFKRPTADVVPKSKVEFLRKTIAENAQKSLEVTLEEIEKAKAETAREIFEKIERVGEIYEYRAETICYFPNGFLAELKKKYTEGIEIVRDLAEYAVDQDIQNYKENN